MPKEERKSCFPPKQIRIPPSRRLSLSSSGQGDGRHLTDGTFSGGGWESVSPGVTIPHQIPSTPAIPGTLPASYSAEGRAENSSSVSPFTYFQFLQTKVLGEKKKWGGKRKMRNGCLKCDLQVWPENNYFKSGGIKFNAHQFEHVLFISEYHF